jgi:hypothetical protein
LDIYGQDIIIGNFRASDFNLMLGSLDYDDSAENEMGNDIAIAEQFIGRNPVPVYLDYTYSEKLKPTITLIKNNCHDASDFELSEYEIRYVLRLITGQHDYLWMKIITDDISEDNWYKVKVIRTALLKRGNKNIGLKIEMECDSQFGYSSIQTIRINENSYSSFNIFNNSDDIYTYLLPTTIITMHEAGNLEIKNSTEGWSTIITNLSVGEVITMDSEKQILTSTVNHTTSLINEFNLHWIRFVDGMNNYQANLSCDITFNFRTRRKGGFICN